MEKAMKVGKLEWFLYCNRRFLSAGIATLLYVLGFIYFKMEFPEGLIIVLIFYGILGTIAAILGYEELRNMIKYQVGMKLEFEKKEQKSMRKHLLEEEQEKATAQHLSKKREIELDSQKEKLRILKNAKGVVCIIYPKKEEVPNKWHYF